MEGARGNDAGPREGGPGGRHPRRSRGSHQGHPVEIMDMSFAIQAVSAGYLAQNARRLQPRVYPVPPALDMKVARLKLRSMGVRIDHLTKAQRAYLNSWQEGT